MTRARLAALFFMASGMLISGCSDDDGGGDNNNNNTLCGNGVIDDGEDCDGLLLGGTTCQDLGYDRGTLACSADCSFSTVGCINDPECGNSMVEGNEVCDGASLAGHTCQSEGFDGGTLACSSDCLTFDTSGCCAHTCTTAGTTQCDGDWVQTCAVSTGSCNAWENTTDCSATSQNCFLVAGNAECHDPCTSDCTTLDEYRCGPGGDVEICAQQGGCINWTLDTDCVTPQICDDSQNPPICRTIPPGETCTQPLVITVPATVDGSDFQSTYEDNYSFTGASCPTSYTGGQDLVLAVHLTNGQTIVVTELGELSAQIRLLGTCSATADCLASDEASTTTPATFTYTATADATYFIVLEAMYPSSTYIAYELHVTHPESDCGNSADDDYNGLTDCADPSCFGNATYCSTEAICDDNQDNDADGNTDCFDPDCSSATNCQPRYGIWEFFDATNEFDLVGCQIDFTVDGTSYQHNTTCTGFSAFPITPGTGTVAASTLAIADDSYQEYTLAGSWDFSFYGLTYGSFYVGSNGYLTFGTGDGSIDYDATDFFDLPHIGALSQDIDPNGGLDGTIYVDEFADHVAVTFQDVPLFSYPSDLVSFQMVLYEDGSIALSYLRVDHLTSGRTVGLCNGGPFGPLPPPTDFWPYPSPGDVIVTEVMWSAAAAVTDANGEYVELFNRMNKAMVLDGCTVEDDTPANAHTFGSLSIPARSYAVLVRNADPAQNGGITGGYSAGNAINLANGGDRIRIACGGNTVDEVDFGSGWPAGSQGTSMQLAVPAYDAGLNDLQNFWCASTNVHSGDITGTPGTDNNACLGSATLIASQDFESDPSWTLAGDWQWGTPATGPGACAGGTGCYGTNMAGDYSHNMTYATNYLQFGPLDLSSATGQTLLLFDMWLQTEEDYDYAQVQVSTDGVNFASLPMADPAYNVGTEWHGDLALAWRPASANLSTYNGQATVYLRFALSTDSSITYPGFYVDNVVVAEY